jgi:predicted TIM-barrel fold metal-dependent hydrolase
MNYTRRSFIKQSSILTVGASLVGNASLLQAGDVSFDDEGAMSQYFDAFTLIGPRRYKHPAERWQLTELLQEMDHCSIAGAMVASTLSTYYDPMYSNLELSGQLKSHSNLFAIWNIMPHQTGEFPKPGELEQQMKEHNVRAVSIHPLANGWDWKAKTSMPLLKWIEEQKLFTVLTAPELGGWTGVDEFLTRYPNIPVFLTDASWIEQRYLIPLLESHRNLHISFDHFQINQGIEFLCKSGYENQLIYASNAPAMSMGAHRTYIDYAEIPEEAKKKVQGGNLIRLLGGQAPPTRAKANPKEDVLMTAVRMGKPVPAPIIDMHMHVLNEGLNGAGGAGYRMEHGGPKGVFSTLKRLGYNGGGFMSWNGVVSNDAVGGNLATATALDVAPPGYWGLATLNTTHFSQSQFRSMIKEVYHDKRFIGMKPYHFYGVEYHHPSYNAWWEYGNERNFYALIHSERPDLVEIDTLAKRYPNVRWLSAHACGSYKMADMVIEVMKKRPNVYAEITLTPVRAGIIEYLVDAVGDDRVVYGSDLPMRDPRQQLGWLVFSKLPLASKKRILATNALKVIQPCLSQLPMYNQPKMSSG